ncbi:tripartite tricarboxylate transporter substrate binding protein [Dankookia rubra]|uniref:Tripartite tricarboxylate transporter substrate binding protein n=2 Tax=Dankookia rubra TaxID=1442381 RepID=A0A4R5Q8G9_9PROT|nr:tripartite tricarboxylate transporter substrate binding protein [Dankookia rubra]
MLSRRQLPALALALGAVLPGRARAAYPDRPVRIIVPFAPGGGTDIIARVMSEGMARELGQPVIVDNKPGAGTIIGNDVVAKSPPDGYTLLLASFAFAVAPAVQPKLPYAGNAAFAPVTLIGRSPNVLLVNAAGRIGSVADLLAAARKDPGAITYASFGNATSAHLAGALFAHLAQVELTHVPYRGSGPALTDLLAGRVDMLFATAATVASATSGGRLRAIAVTSAERSAAFPGVPTVTEAGVPGYASEGWYGLYAPAGTPPETIDRLNVAANQAIRTETFQRQVAEEGLTTVGGPPAQLVEYVRTEEARWREVVQRANITAE